MYRLTNPILHYDWGSPTVIPDYLGTVADGRPQAEVWMGAHPSAPSLAARVANVPEDPQATHPPVALSEIIGRDPHGTLGEPLVQRFGPQLPFLAKLLAADKPLSLQVHPTQSRAAEQYRKESDNGTPRGRRNYMDPNHKPELLMALAPTLALVGFRSASEAATTFAYFQSPAATQIADVLNGQGSSQERIRAAFIKCLDLSQEATAAILGELPAPSDEPNPSKPLEVASTLAAHHQQDPGAVASLLLNTVLLDPGEGLYVPSGIIHAYVRGFGLEVMASSDNVLRAGLTHKRVDRQELMEAASFTPQEPLIVRGEPQRSGAAVTYRYRTPESDFSLRVIERVEQNSTVAEAKLTLVDDPAFVDDATPVDGLGARILICLEGESTIMADSGSLTLQRGEAAFIGAADGQAKVGGVGRVAVVSAESQ